MNNLKKSHVAMPSSFDIQVRLIDDSAKGGLTQFWELSTMILYASKYLTLSHLGDLIHSQPWGGGLCPSPLRNFAFLDPNKTKFGVLIVSYKKKKN